MAETSEQLSRARRSSPVFAAVLIGGASTRMGRPKHLLRAGAESWLERTVRQVAGAVAETVLVGRGDVPASLAGLRRLADVPDASGPMAGILAAMRSAPRTSWLIVACDMPEVSRAAADWLLGQRRPDVWAVIPRLGEDRPLEPLLAYYDFRARPLIEKLAAAGRSRPAEIATSSKVITPVPPAHLAGAWTNINRPEELRPEDARPEGVRSEGVGPDGAESGRLTTAGCHGLLATRVLGVPPAHEARLASKPWHPPTMKIICVAGAASGVGKTTVACAMLHQLLGWAAIKVTRTHGRGPCPHGWGCRVCATLDEPGRLLEMSVGDDVPGKDTWRLREAGALRVLWLIARPEAVERGLRQALRKLRKAPGVVVEGNSAVPLIEADLVVMVRRRGEEMSPSAREAARYVDQTIYVAAADPASKIEKKCRRIVREMATPTPPGTRRS